MEIAGILTGYYCNDKLKTSSLAATLTIGKIIASTLSLPTEELGPMWLHILWTNPKPNGKNTGFRRMIGQKSQIKCALCGKTILSKVKEKEGIVEIIDDKTYTFDTNDCVLMFKKFRGVYGTDFI
jgi:hypothetical protein